MLPIEILIEIAMANMFAFGILIRTCRAIARAFAHLPRRAKMALFMTWRTRSNVHNYTESYWEYLDGGEAVPHVVKLRHDNYGRLLMDADMWMGRRWGLCIKYYEYDEVATSIIRTRAWYVAGRKHGKYLEYHINGTLMCESVYVNGILHGESRAYHSCGRIRSIKHYTHGIAHEWSEYDREGRLCAHSATTRVTTRALKLPKCVIL